MQTFILKQRSLIETRLETWIADYRFQSIFLLPVFLLGLLGLLLWAWCLKGLELLNVPFTRC